MNWKSLLVIFSTSVLLAACSTLGKQPTENTLNASKEASGDAAQSSLAADPLAQRSVYFDFDSSVVRLTDEVVISNHATYLKSKPSLRIRLQGNTDSRGSREYNLALGQRRAESVKKALALLGVDPNQLEAVSFGMEKLVAFGETEADHAKNRRVDFAYE